MKSRQFGLSKSRITAFEQCPRKLWLSVHHPEQAVRSAASMARMNLGNAAGAIARTAAPGGRLIETQQNLTAALEETNALIKAGWDKPIYEATFAYSNVLVQADILEPLGNGTWSLGEVKSSTSVKDYYLGDLATQVWVLNNAGLSIASAEIWHINTNFVLEAVGQYGGLFVRSPQLAQIQAIIGNREQTVLNALSTLQSAEPDVEMGAHCSSPFECEFQAYCARKLPPGPEWPIALLPNVGKRLASEWAIRGIADLRELPEWALKKEQHQVVQRATITGETFLNRDGALRDTAKWKWPRHFLDFETIAPPVPRWVGTRPYQQVPFQFSCHSQSEARTVSHSEFLSRDDADPRRPLAEKLVEALCSGEAADGTIVAYNAPFERRCVRELAASLPDLAPQLRDIEARIVDLLPVARANYYHRDQRGSWSIKSVLPTIDPSLSYSDLVIGNGELAQVRWLEAISDALPLEARHEIFDALLRYCKQDTWAMIVVADALLGGPPTAAAT